MLIIFVRTLIIYLVVLFILRTMGKGELSSMDPFQVVISFMIAELATLSIESADVSLLSGIAALFTLLFLQVLFSYLSLKSEAFKKLVNGKPSLLIDRGVIDKKEMDRLRISLDDLSQQLRIKNYPSIADVEYAVLEVNGDLSVISTVEKETVKREDLKIPFDKEYLPTVVISDGKLYKKNLVRLKMNEEMFKAKLYKLGITDYRQIFLCFNDEKGKLHLYKKEPNQDKLKMISEKEKEASL